MAEKPLNNNANSSDEIDLGQLFQLIGRGFNKIGTAFLRLFLYFKKNILILGGLVVVGLAVGYGLNKIVSKKLKTEVIVKPNMESKNYLYDVIDEIQANIKAENSAFFNEIGIDVDDLKDLEIEINKVENDNSSESDTQYLELLQSFEKTDAISDIVRAELENKSSFNHRITIFYKNRDKGEMFATGIVKYINNNKYFDGIIQIYRANAEGRIAENKTLLKQIDELIANYSKKMASEDSLSGSERLILENQEQIDVTGLFNLKRSLIRDIEDSKMDLEENTEAIKVINFGKPQEVQKTVYGNTIFLIPLILIGIFFFISSVRYLNRKSAEI